jgi:hypothetical protein
MPLKLLSQKSFNKSHIHLVTQSLLDHFIVLHLAIFSRTSYTEFEILLSSQIKVHKRCYLEEKMFLLLERSILNICVMPILSN